MAFDNLKFETARGMVLRDEILTKIYEGERYSTTWTPRAYERGLDEHLMPPRRRAPFDNLDRETAGGRVFAREVLTKICMPPRKLACCHEGEHYLTTWILRTYE